MFNVKDILEKDSGIYTTTNSEGNNVTILRQKGYGFTLMTSTHDDWYECVDYGED